METETMVVSDGKVVSLEYTLTVGGQVIDSSGETPLEYLQGYHNIIPGLERELTGMTAGESKDVTIAPADAYGEYDAKALYDIPRTQFPASYQLAIGAPVRVRTDSGRVAIAYIQSIDDANIRLDLNHPLAGKELFFQAKIVALRDGTPEELDAGRVGGCSSCGSSQDCGGSCC